MKEQIKKYVQIDPFTTRDPLEEKDDYEYSVIIDKNNTNRIISIVAIIKDTGVQLPWDSILENYLVRLSIAKAEAASLKYELMPKDTNNFYPFRQSAKIVGHITFAFQICGLHQ